MTSESRGRWRCYATLAVAFAGGLGCGGRAGAGTEGASAAAAATQRVNVSTLQGGVPACRAGYAHPNVCCASGPGRGTVCTESVGTPFSPCARTSLTFPDAATCCTIDGDAAHCERADTDATADAGAAGDCYFPCGPGAYAPSERPTPASLLLACTDVAADVASCSYCCEGSGIVTSCTSSECFCPPTGPCPCLPQCGSCPVGWQTAQGVPDLCCRTSASGVVECFSQANAIQPLRTSSCGVDRGLCQCFEYTGDGNYYDLTCGQDGTPDCTCSVNGTKTRTLGADADCPSFSLGQECGFPPP